MTEAQQRPPTGVSETAGDGRLRIGDPVLCLSGGGFRATLFHLGAARRLNELGVLSRVSAITSASGGSILNGFLATRWASLVADANGTFANFDAEVGRPVRAFCRRDLRTGVLVGTRIDPSNWGVLCRGFFSVPANYLAAAYQSAFRHGRLSEVPPPGPATPRFVFCATSVRSGGGWHFHAGPDGRMGDGYGGYTHAGDVTMATAVAASSAFPPAFGALRLRLPHPDRPWSVGLWGDEPEPPAKGRDRAADGRRLALLIDGGVYDHLGVEPVWDRFNCMLVSDAGRPLESLHASRQSLIPRLFRALDISVEQVGDVRKRWLASDLADGRRTGALWTIGSPMEDFQVRDARGYGPAVRSCFTVIRTDLNAFSEGEVACLENHGYAVADAAVRSRAAELCPNLDVPFRWPNHAWSDDETAHTALRLSGRRRILREIWRHACRA